MLIRIVLTIAALGATISAEPVHDGEIVTNRDEFPFIVKLTMISKGKSRNSWIESFCVGSIINSNAIITAAHCIYDSENKLTRISVVAGRIDFRVPGSQQERLAKAYKIHEDYKTIKQNIFTRHQYQPNDIAILWLDRPLEINQFVQEAVFAKQDINVGGIVGTSAGWGIQECGAFSKVLKKVNLKGITQKDCVKEHNYHLTRDAFCAASVNGKSLAANGDSGCPFVHNNQILGILSFGTRVNIKLENGREFNTCDPNHPLVYTKVSKYSKWIQNSVNLKLPKKLCKTFKKFSKFCALF